MGEGSVKGSDCVLEWIGTSVGPNEGSLLAMEESIQRNKKKESIGDNSSGPYAFGVYRSEEMWLDEIWSALLSDDDTNVGYWCYPVREIYSIFKRRHHLKYTALELTDIHGYSVLISCINVDITNQLLVAMLGSDMPFPIGDPAPLDVFDGVQISASQKQDMFCGVAKTLFGI